MPGSKDHLCEQMKVHQKAYAAEFQNKNSQIQAIFSKLSGSEEDKSLVRDLHGMIHKIAGSGASLGFSSLGRTARTLDIYLQSLIRDNALPTLEQRIKIGESIRELAQTFENPCLRETSFKPVDMHSRHTRKTGENSGVIFIVQNDNRLACNMAVQLDQFGYSVQVLDKPEGVMEAVQKTVPAAIIMDIIFDGNNCTGAETLAKIQKVMELPLHVIFTSTCNSLTARLQAVRAGGDAYFIKPVDIAEIVEVLDRLTGRDTPEPYRILIIEDEPELAHYYSLILSQAGMITEVVTDPMQIMGHLTEFSPDLIIMDLYMPGCNGLELASVIRQINAFVSIPIVFLSIETNIRRQMDAMRLGGDYFLTKPIEPGHLTSLVTSRVERARILRSHMTCDSMTGLLNHTTTKLRLDTEIARAKRQNASLAFALIDIDNFKKVNDTFGHAAGDQVIKSLTMLLKQHLRKTDISGRYGGEEFAVILPDTIGTSAVKVMDKIREAFSEINHQRKDVGFTVNLSCGISCSPPNNDSNTLINAADEALYEAKRNGRNRVELTGQ